MFKLGRIAQLPRRYLCRKKQILPCSCGGGAHDPGLSQLALAGRAGISRRHLSFVELGRAKPSRDMVGQIAKVLEAVKNNPESTER
jgi:DNA-binding XRE family transcriptional regulator